MQSELLRYRQLGLGNGDVKDDKVWYAVREGQLAVHEALENIVFL